MDALTNERRRELILRVFPDLRFGGDPDIERYFEHRRDGRMGAALAVYNGPLRARYPDDARRILLLRLYRENDPAWERLQDSLILELAGRIAQGLARNIDLLAAPLSGLDRRDAFKALSVAEALMRIIPAKDDEALVFLDRYHSFANLLGHRAEEIDRARGLVREYVAMTKADTPSEYDFIARSEALEARRRETEAADRARRGSAAPREAAYDFIAGSEALEARRRKEEEARSRFFDLSRLHFSAEDKARIEIPEVLTRREDRVLAYCWKYWELVADPGFERLVFLWSRKHGTRHWAIFHAIKVGRQRRLTDDEILTAVSTILSTSYSYSVSGDLYMQAAWRRLKARAEAERAAALEAAANEALEATSRRRKERDSVPETRDGPVDASPRPVPPKKAAPAPSRRAAGAKAKSGELRSLGGGAKRVATRDLIRAPKAQAPEPMPELVARGGSVSDRIRKLSGKAYDVHRQLFLAEVRADIHRHLVSSRKRSFRIFDDSANAAEDVIYAYLSDHYADPYMSWEESPERARVEDLGHSLPSLDPIIEAWYRRQ